MAKQNRVIVISFADEFTDEYDHVQNMKIDKENVSKFVCEAIRDKLNAQTGKITVVADSSNFVNFEKRLKMLEEEFKKIPETKVVYIQKEEKEQLQNTKEFIVDNELKQMAGAFEW